ncbi:MAG TPA: DUF4266 domain-containing protein [Polyangiaceae bacterium]|nr:DUF4266 domain-containing protein [Polyangiaceae bacterium]
MKQIKPHHRSVLTAGLFAFVLSFATGCVTVRPEQRSILADPTMQMKSSNRDEAALQHVLENREGSFGGGTVEGGGCGCN